MSVFFARKFPMSHYIHHFLICDLSFCADDIHIKLIQYDTNLCSLFNTKYLYQVQETLKRLCEFSTVWADWAGLGSQKSSSKLTSILPRKTHDYFQIDIQKITQIKKSLAPSYLKPKKECWFQSMIKKTHGSELKNIFY